MADGNYVVMGSDSCPWCVKAEKLLSDAGKPYSTYNVKQNAEAKEFLLMYARLLGVIIQTIPQVLYVKEGESIQLIGGYEDLVKHFEE